MIKFLEHKDIDKTKWDACIENAKNSLIYANSWYLNIVSPNWSALIEDNYQSVFPLTWRKKYNIHYLFQPFFTQQLGIFSLNDIPNSLVEDFINAIPKKFYFIDINLNYSNHTSLFKLISKTNLILECNSSNEISHNIYSENTRRNIKKANRNNLTISKNTSVDTLINLFKLNKGVELKHINNKAYKTLKILLELMLEKNIAEIHSVYNTLGVIIASVYFIKTNKRDIFFFSALTEQGKETGAMFYIIDEYIKHITSTSVIFDFEGSNDINLARFYKSFGAQEQNYYHLKINNLPPILRKFKT